MTLSRPTMHSAALSMAGFLDSAKYMLRSSASATELRMYFYAVTQAGWRELASSAAQWKRRDRRRLIKAYVGTDHGLTEPGALELMQKDEVEVRILRRYNGIFHPKVLWLVNPAGTGVLLAGSNNLTLDGLRSNIEFATLTRLAIRERVLERWHKAIHRASDPLSEALLATYAAEREAFGQARARSRVARTFTWSERFSAPEPLGARQRSRRRTVGSPRNRGLRSPTPLEKVGHGDLLIEVMPLETGTGGSQIQVPMEAATKFFGLGRATQASVVVELRNAVTDEARRLTMTRFGNATARLVIHELDYRDRPCLIQFRRVGRRSYDFEIVRLAIDPDRYRALMGLCGPPTRQGSRAWAQVSR